jgi:hypothetical protein
MSQGGAAGSDPNPAGQAASIDKALTEAEASLKTVDSTPFSPKAFQLFTSSVSEYTRDLASESLRNANRSKADSISRTHVENARQYLVSSHARPMLQHLSTAGGIFVGAGVGNLLALVSTKQPFTTAGVVWTAASFLVGAFLIALHVGRDISW